MVTTWRIFSSGKSLILRGSIGKPKAEFNMDIYRGIATSIYRHPSHLDESGVVSVPFRCVYLTSMSTNIAIEDWVSRLD